MVKNTRRCDAILVQLVVTEYDEHGRPIGEGLSNPIKIFRNVANVWGAVDRALASAQQAPPPPPRPTPAPPSVTRGKRK